ncbi:helix-turn-helix domain-containing protein [Paenibacillus hexagrammi]|uniref:Helix-turn-helix domain-containing protein n=1 Tax=Paenibacillus hexagrammi TaxID=2908839 RepID=A0ABY3ST21_9BACL|nr:helix-turn-helix domain-containing protein [Paenibacillus sp. YPD9-1]UJF36568.1 helix-turn-helix domain-containing protein [Paenibacillus sp. YPD9-1]
MMLETVVHLRGTVYERGYGMIAQKAMRDRTISAKAKALYAYLCSFAGSIADTDRTAFPGVTLMMEDLGIKSDDTYYKIRKELINAGYITVEQKQVDGRFAKCVYTIEAVVTPPKPKEEEAPPEEKTPHPKNSGTEKSTYPKNSSTINSDSENMGIISISSKSISKSMYVCMDEIAASIESVDNSEPDPIIEKVIREADECGIQAYAGEIYSMLVKQFPTQLDPEVIEIAGRIYFERTHDMTTVPFKPKLAVDNPTGMFYDCYKDAIKEWKVGRYKKERSAQA